MTPEYILQKDPHFWWNIWLNSKSGLDFEIYGGFAGIEFLYDGDPIAVIANVGSSSSFLDGAYSSKHGPKRRVITSINFYVDHIFSFKPSFIYDDASDLHSVKIAFHCEQLLQIDPHSSRTEVEHILFLMKLSCGATP